MRKQLFYAALFLLPISLNFSCKKDLIQKQEEDIGIIQSKQNQRTETDIPPFNLDVFLRCQGKKFGHVKFRQDNDDRIIDLGTSVSDLEPNHEYNLQRL